MQNKIITLALSGFIALTITACGEVEPKAPEKAVTLSGCKIEGTLAPTWACVPNVTGHYAGVGIAQKSAAGIAHMRKVALMNGRSDLTQQIQTEVKDKMEGFTRATGDASAETIDKVTTSVTKQLAKVNLQGSKAVDYWEAPSGAIYMLVTVPKAQLNNSVKEAIHTSYKNDAALWQQFQAKQALEQLDKEFSQE